MWYGRNVGSKKKNYEMTRKSYHDDDDERKCAFSWTNTQKQNFIHNQFYRN